MLHCFCCAWASNRRLAAEKPHVRQVNLEPFDHRVAQVCCCATLAEQTSNSHSRGMACLGSLQARQGCPEGTKGTVKLG